MVGALDRALGRIIDAVKASEAGEEGTVVVFMSDNGGRILPDHPDIEPNVPLKGGKGEVYEGGTRVPGLIWGGGTPKNATFSGLFHMVDWVATRAHNLCHDNRQLIVIAINRNRSAIKINCN